VNKRKRLEVDELGEEGDVTAVREACKKLGSASQVAGQCLTMHTAVIHDAEGTGPQPR
jgi:hypothetical protein